MDELPTLLERFHPLVISRNGADTPKYYIINKETVKINTLRLYSIKSLSGDTVPLSGGRIGDIHLEDVPYQKPKS